MASPLATRGSGMVSPVEHSRMERMVPQSSARRRREDARASRIEVLGWWPRLKLNGASPSSDGSGSGHGASGLLGRGGSAGGAGGPGEAAPFARCPSPAPRSSPFRSARSFSSSRSP
eukprot:scaffold15758_cov63-Phaeocystis_antarctica.AAC.2